ncbi:MAG: site-specific DNA-methyltransferase [Candidatus Aenigmarchaeota archaeon]|nr:site-specific DNA-methyltransferase [Candidatus Aenigmarchaeota archaeon]
MGEINCPEWKIYPKNMGNKLHSICSYMAMYPPSIPNYFIDKYSKKGDLVLDPFSGRGTTVLEGCLLERKAIGNDRNILAAVLSRSKASVPQKGRIISRIKSLKENYKKEEIDTKHVDKKIKMIFGEYTLNQLVYLKKELKWKKSNVDIFITAMVLGIMHGGSKGYLSIQMPNTFSMSPNYVKNYIKEHHLRKPKRDVFRILNEKLERCYQKCSNKGKIYMQDARNMSRIKDSSVDLIVTSPPYTRLITYGTFNWIRLWFLGKDGVEVDKKLFVTQSIDKYCNFMNDVLREFERVLKPEGKAVLVIGDVKKKESTDTINLAESVWERCAKEIGFSKVEDIINDVIYDENNGNPKVSRIWGEKRGNATKVDRILVLKK